MDIKYYEIVNENNFIVSIAFNHSIGEGMAQAKKYTENIITKERYEAIKEKFQARPEEIQGFKWKLDTSLNWVSVEEKE